MSCGMKGLFFKNNNDTNARMIILNIYTIIILLLMVA
jgi:hypothetical protein